MTRSIALKRFKPKIGTVAAFFGPIRGRPRRFDCHGTRRQIRFAFGDVRRSTVNVDLVDRDLGVAQGFNRSHCIDTKFKI